MKPSPPAPSTAPLRLAILGAGWAGMAAAVRAVELGHHVTVFEAARTLGGRARGVALALPDGREVMVDNGQHILIGAYSDSLRLMRTVGVDPDTALLRRPQGVADAMLTVGPRTHPAGAGQRSSESQCSCGSQDEGK